MSAISPEQGAAVTEIYKKRFDVDVTAIGYGIGNIFKGKLAEVTFSIPSGKAVPNIVFFDSAGAPVVFATTQEFLQFIQQKSPRSFVDFVKASDIAEKVRMVLGFVLMNIILVLLFRHR